MPRNLTIKQRKFITAVAGHGNATQAAIDAGYDVQDRQSAKAIAGENLLKPAIRTALDAELARRGLDEIAISDVIADVMENGTPSERLRAVELLVRLRGDEPPRKNVSVKLSYAEHVKRQLAERAEGQEAEKQNLIPKPKVVVLG